MVNNSTNINKTNNNLSPKESVNSDGQQFKNNNLSKESDSTIPPISTKQTILPKERKQTTIISHQKKF